MDQTPQEITKEAQLAVTDAKATSSTAKYQAATNQRLLMTLMGTLLTVALLNLLATTSMFAYFIYGRQIALAERHQIIVSMNHLEDDKIERTEAQKTFNAMDAKLSTVFDLATDIRKRQIINEANIEINHDAIGKIAKTIPATKPIEVPEQIALPPATK